MDEEIKKVLELAKVGSAVELAHVLWSYYWHREKEAEGCGYDDEVKWLNERKDELANYISHHLMKKAV